MKPMATCGILALLLGFSGCSKTPSPEVKLTQPDRSSSPNMVQLPDPRGIRTMMVQARLVPDYLEVPARIQADPARVVRVFPPVSGRLVAVQVSLGEHVREGQTLALLQSSDVSAARVDFQKAQVEAQVKDKALRRASLLFENQVLAEKEYQQALADAEIARAELVRARERLRILGIDAASASDRIPVVAPRSGVVVEIGAAPGELSKSLDSSSPLCTLADLGRVWVAGDVYEKDLASLALGSPAEVTVNAYPAEKLRGTGAVLADTVDPVTRTLKIRVALPNPGWRLKPEMFATLRLFRSTPPSLLIPGSAVLRDYSTTSVFIEKSPGLYERRLVTLGRTVDTQVEVTSGLKPGETVVVEGALLLRTPTS